MASTQFLQFSDAINAKILRLRHGSYKFPCFDGRAALAIRGCEILNEIGSPTMDRDSICHRFSMLTSGLDAPVSDYSALFLFSLPPAITGTTDGDSDKSDHQHGYKINEKRPGICTVAAGNGWMYLDEL